MLRCSPAAAEGPKTFCPNPFPFFKICTFHRDRREGGGEEEEEVEHKSREQDKGDGVGCVLNGEVKRSDLTLR